MLNVYADFCEESLAMPVVRGRKSESDKLAGAEDDVLRRGACASDGVALQAGTSHYFGGRLLQGRSVFSILIKTTLFNTFTQTSWGVTTRLIGAVIMVHGDDNGLILPPAIAPIQAVIIPIAMHKPGVTEKAQELEAALKAAGIRVEC